MQGKEQKAYLPKLDIEGNNWVIYWNHLLWTLKHNNIKEYIANDSLPQSYTNKGKVGSLKLQER